MKRMDNGTTKQLLRYERERRGWSRNYVAEKIESDPQTVGRWERGKTFPNPYFRQRLCELFGKNAEELGLMQNDGASHTNRLGVTVEQPDFTSAQSIKTELHEEHSEQSEEGESEKIQHVSESMHPMPHLISREQRMGLSSNIAIIGLAIIIAAIILSVPFWRLLAFPPSSDTSSTRPKIMPGGTWVGPVNGKSYSGVVNFSALAYPTHPGEPEINHVNFTANWQSGWRVVCTAYPPAVQNIYTCNANLQQLGAPTGPIRISFDVYDQMDNVNFAPNGEHTILYLS